MRITAFIVMLFLCYALLGCKSRKSHVVKSTTESVQSNHEVKNLDVRATSFKVQNTSLTIDSTWMNTIRLVNFTGTINTGKVEGSADQAEVVQSGNKKQQANQSQLQNDSSTIHHEVERESERLNKQRKTVADKETKGVQVPWWGWLLGLGAVLFFIRSIYNRIKSKLNPF